MQSAAVIQPTRQPVPVPGLRLSPRERDCLVFVAQGKSDWEIGMILGVSKTTAHTHIENAKRKLDCRTRAQAVVRLYGISFT